jgi:hypothetical protein
MVIARRLLAGWRRAFKISSILAFPGANQTPMIMLRNVGRTGIDFQCRVKTINGLLACIAFESEVGTGSHSNLV